MSDEGVLAWVVRFPETCLVNKCRSTLLLNSGFFQFSTTIWILLLGNLSRNPMSDLYGWGCSKFSPASCAARGAQLFLVSVYI